MVRSIKNLRRNTKGATAIEYSLIAALIGVAAITAFSSVGTAVKGQMNAIGTAVQTGSYTAPATTH